jgi:hypothetical protein
MFCDIPTSVHQCLQWDLEKTTKQLEVGVDVQRDPGGERMH